MLANLVSADDMLVVSDLPALQHAIVKMSFLSQSVSGVNSQGLHLQVEHTRFYAVRSAEP